MMREFRRFTECDWRMYGGAEKFDNGNQPLIGENDNFSIVISKDVLQIYVFVDVQPADYTFYLPIKGLQEDVLLRIGVDLFHQLMPLDEIGVVKHLRACGYREC